MNRHQKSKGSTGLIVLVVISVIIALVAMGIAIYFWQKSQKSNEEKSTTTTTETTTTSTQETNTATVESPKEVVESFMNYTLGTLPGAVINYDKARTYLTESLKAQHSGEGWVPQFYGIQDGPTSVKYISQNISGNTATVRYDPSWGETSLGWSFTLEKKNNLWLISGFRNDAQ